MLLLPASHLLRPQVCLGGRACRPSPGADPGADPGVGPPPTRRPSSGVRCAARVGERAAQPPTAVCVQRLRARVVRPPHATIISCVPLAVASSSLHTLSGRTQTMLLNSCPHAHAN